ncbi:MAG: polysaccharide deacetylase family protein [Rhizobiaceae bacterium]
MIDAAYIARKTFFAAATTLNLRALAPKRFAGAGAILMLHRVSPDCRSPLGVHAGLCITPQFLDELIPALKQLGHDFIAMDDLPQRLAKPTGRPFLTVTFDDGYKDNAVHAYPVLQRHNVPYTVYIAPGLTNGDTFLWWELLEQVIWKQDTVELGSTVIDCKSMSAKRSAFFRIHRHLLHDLPETQMPSFIRDFAAKAGKDARAYGKAELLDWTEIRKAARDPLCTIGTHTMNHYHLARLDNAQLQSEFDMAAKALEAETGVVARHVAYPYGYDIGVGLRETQEASRRKYVTGVTTRHGVIFGEHRSAITALPRISVNGNHQSVSDVRLMLSGLTSLLAHRHGGPVTL